MQWYKELKATATLLEEIASTIRLKADTAGRSNRTAVSACDGTERGDPVALETVTPMETMTEFSEQMTEIMGAIDNLTRQTTLLALNSSKEITILITDSGAAVKTKAQLIDQSDETLTEMAAEVKKIVHLIAKINSASNRQSHGIQQTNTSQIEELRAAAQALVAQAEELSAQVAKIKLGRGTAFGPRPTHLIPVKETCDGL